LRRLKMRNLTGFNIKQMVRYDLARQWLDKCFLVVPVEVC